MIVFISNGKHRQCASLTVDKLTQCKNQEDSAPNTTHILVNNHKEYSGPRHKDSITQQFECTTQRREDYTHAHTHTHQEQELPDTQETEEEY